MLKNLNYIFDVVVLTIFVFTCNANLTPLKQECDFSPGDLKDILNGVEIALGFLDRNLDNLVADVAFGTLVFSGQIKLILESHGNQLPPSFQLDLVMTQEKALRITKRVVENLMNNSYFTTEGKENQLHWISDASLWLTPSLADGWNSFEIPNGLIMNNMPFDLYHEVLNDELSDACVKQLYNNCNISSECVDLFMKQPHSGYSLTHQVLFFLVVRKEKCHLKWFRGQTESESQAQFMDPLCRKVFLEASVIEKRNFPVKSRDIFSEQVAVCALAGYQNFLQPKWLRNILSWQNVTSTSSAFGCFSKQDLKSSKDNSISQRRRKKRYDAVLSTTDKENCSLHFTSVSLGAMAMYLRYFFDSCSWYDNIQ